MTRKPPTPQMPKKPKTIKDVARNVKPKKTPLYGSSFVETPEHKADQLRKNKIMRDVVDIMPLTLEFIAVAAKHKAPTRTTYDLLMALCGLVVFFTVTHGLAGWPL